MKKHLIIIMLLSNLGLSAQIRDFNNIPNSILIQLNKMGVNSSSFLNTYENDYLNFVFKDSLNEFDFTGKKIGFIFNGVKSNKKEYFDLEKDRFKCNSTTNNGKLYVFDAAQKEESGGYDGAIVYWSKRLIPIEEIIRKLKENN